MCFCPKIRFPVPKKTKMYKFRPISLFHRFYQQKKWLNQLMKCTGVETNNRDNYCVINQTKIVIESNTIIVITVIRNEMSD